MSALRKPQTMLQMGTTEMENPLMEVLVKERKKILT